MAIIPTRGAVPIAGAQQTAALTLGQLPGLRSERVGLVMTRLADMENERARILQQLAYLRQRKQRKGQERDADRAALGGKIGGAVALAAAPFTGGASLALLPAAVSTGTAIGELGSGQPGGADRLGNAVVPNAFSEFFGPTKSGATPAGFEAGGQFEFLAGG